MPVLLQTVLRLLPVAMLAATLAAWVTGGHLYVTNVPLEVREAFVLPRAAGEALQKAGLPALGLADYGQIHEVRTLGAREAIQNGCVLLSLPTVVVASLIVALPFGILSVVQELGSGQVFAGILHLALGILTVGLVIGLGPLALIFWSLYAGYYLVALPGATQPYVLVMVPFVFATVVAAIAVMAGIVRLFKEPPWRRWRRGRTAG